MSNLFRKSRRLGKKCTLENLALHCRDFGKIKIKRILSRWHVFRVKDGWNNQYETAKALNAIYKYRLQVNKIAFANLRKG